jgi:DUF4097 and DUF4098 domain-containing protein YvlB
MILLINRWIPLFLILPLILVLACTPVPKHSTELEPRLVDATNIRSILIQVDYGEVKILESDDSFVRVNGQVSFADELDYQVDTAGSQISIVLFAHRDNPSRNPLDVVIQVPKQMQVKVETDKAFVWVQEYQGDVEVDSASGNVTVVQMTGAATLHSNRGNISVRDSLGHFSVVGNYGALTVQNASGEISVSTIMGNILFDGSIKSGDITRLETDHGSVSAHLSADSALGIQIRSTSGDVVCMLPDVISSARTCDGEINSGGGALSIRTVSGAVTVQLIP